MKRTLSPAQALATLLLGVGLVTAMSANAMATTALPPEHMVGNVSYVSGGVGKDEADAMKQAAARYPLELTFVTREKDGHEAYLAGDKVVVRDQEGRIVLNARADGPFLLAKLPAGRYVVEAIDHGQAHKRSVTVVPDKHERVVFAW